MSELAVIGSEDTAAAQEIVERTYELLHGMDLIELATPEVKTPDVIGVSGVCVEVSDAVTRAAHDLGVFASRECHEGHFFTSFAPADQPLDEEDPILCLTWGQFKPDVYEKHPGAFFGKRRDICPRVGGYYEGFYASWTAGWRQVAHTPAAQRSEGRVWYPQTGHVWLATTPEDLENRPVPVGQVERSEFPDHMWEPEIILPPSAQK